MSVKLENAKVIAWFSRHAPLPVQLAELDRLFPGHVLRRDIDPFADADVVVERLRAMGAEEVVIVAPLSVLQALTERGIRPLRAVMEECPGPERHLTSGGRSWRFLRFERVLGVKIITEPLE